MKKAFTLVELLIVVVVLVTLMTITLRIGGIGDETTKRNRTINRMQRLENCLSGYYAAYGSYPPVKLHGSRDFMLSTNGYGLQCMDTDDRESQLVWESVEAACKSQPVAFCCPFSRNRSAYVRAVSQLRQQTASTPNPRDSFEALCDNSAVSGWQNRKRWDEAQIFKFGVLSYLLPRYLIAMGGGNSSGDVDHQLFTRQNQWTANNQLPCRFESGVPYGNWQEVCTDVSEHKWKIAVLQSQATCARWLPNLEKTVATTFGTEVYGVEIQADDDEGQNNGWEIYNAAATGSGGKGSNASGQNVAGNRLTVCDGWGHEFYYYSLPPHQSYMLWSGGPNGMTFPHWIVGSELKKIIDQYKDIYDKNGKKLMSLQEAIADDMVQMSN